MAKLYNIEFSYYSIIEAEDELEAQSKVAEELENMRFGEMCDCMETISIRDDSGNQKTMTMKKKLRDCTLGEIKAMLDKCGRYESCIGENCPLFRKPNTCLMTRRDLDVLDTEIEIPEEPTNG